MGNTGLGLGLCAGAGVLMQVRIYIRAGPNMQFTVRIYLRRIQAGYDLF